MMESAGTKPHVRSAIRDLKGYRLVRPGDRLVLPSTFRPVQRGVGTQFIGVQRTLGIEVFAGMLTVVADDQNIRSKPSLKSKQTGRS
jgi:hypothetical protein